MQTWRAATIIFDDEVLVKGNTKGYLEHEIRTILKSTDTCFAHTPQQMHNCDRFCTGHGCPIQEETLKQIMDKINNYENKNQ